MLLLAFSQNLITPFYISKTRNQFITVKIYYKKFQRSLSNSGGPQDQVADQVQKTRSNDRLTTLNVYMQKYQTRNIKCVVKASISMNTRFYFKD